MDIGPSILLIALNVAVVAGALAWLVWLGSRVAKTTLWMPLLVTCGGMIALALLDFADELAKAEGALDLSIELEIAAGSALVLSVAGLLHLASVYPRRVEARWLSWALLAMYALAFLSVLLAPVRVAAVSPAGGAARLALNSGVVRVAIGATFRVSLLVPILWFAFLALRGRNENERKAGRSLALATGTPVAIAMAAFLVGTPWETDEFAVVLFGLWLLGVAVSFARGGLPIPLEASMARVNDSSADAIFVIGADTTVAAANRAAFGFTGLDPPLVGRPFEAAIGAAFKDPASWTHVARQVGDAILAGSKRVEGDAGAVGPQGRLCRFLVDPLRAEGTAGRADGVVLRIRDATAELAAEDVSRRARDLQDLVIRVMGHDLKAPIAVVSGYLELAESALAAPLGEAERAAVRSHLERAGEATSFMSEVMANARAISRITMGGALEAPKESAELSSMLDEVVAVLRPLAQAKRIKVAVDRPPSVRIPLVPGLESVISNLLSNAIKYTPPGGEISATLALRDGSVRLEVADTGPGIPREDRTRLFRKFERLTVDQSPGSHGLGLSIAAAIVGLMDGEISVLDRPDGRGGTMFRVDIPWAGARAAAPLP